MKDAAIAQNLAGMMRSVCHYRGHTAMRPVHGHRCHHPAHAGSLSRVTQCTPYAKLNIRAMDVSYAANC